MRTRAIITRERLDGKAESIYLHWDGYPEYTGKLLLEYYNDAEKIDQLLKMGDVSSLDKSIDCPDGHSFDNPVDGYTVFYKRDRGDTDVDSIEHDSVEDAVNDIAMWQDFHYIYKNNRWYVVEVHGNNEPRLLTEVVG